MHPREFLTQLVVARNLWQTDVETSTGQRIHIAVVISDETHDVRTLLQTAQEMGWTKGHTGNVADPFEWVRATFNHNNLDYIEVRRYDLFP